MYLITDFYNDVEEKLRILFADGAKVYLDDIEQKLDKDTINDIIEDILDTHFYSIENAVEEMVGDMEDEIDDRLDSLEKWDEEE